MDAAAHLKKIDPADDSGSTERVPDQGSEISIGQWYWLRYCKSDKEDRIMAVTKIGSNFVELSSVWGCDTRVHFKDFEKTCRREMDPESVIRGYVEHYKKVVQDKIREINEITARLGVNQQYALEHRPAGQESTRALAVLSGTDNVKSYKKALIKAKDKDLPRLFEEVEEASKGLATWMKAQTLPMLGMVENMKGCVGEIEDRIFNVSLYAGLTEHVEEVKKGKAAPASERLRIMQRMCYMDEECLVNYRTGGMEFKDIEDFDSWLASPENFERILPFPRCMVAFRVRRFTKEREYDGSVLSAFINMGLAESDKFTFMYIRNGEKLYRMGCELEFGAMIFPGREEFNLNEPMYAEMFCSRVQEIITKRHYDEIVKEFEEKKRKQREWAEANKGKPAIENPHGMWEPHMDKYEPFTPESVYYDEIKGEIEARVKHYNRIALIVQGLYDRSDVLHPHPPVRLWSPGGFEAAVELIYADHALYAGGEPPNFEEYRARCNASIEQGSITVGQQDYFEAREAKKYNARNFDRNYHPSRHKPYGNPGPGYFAEVVEWSERRRRATFRWTRERRTSDYWAGKRFGDPIPAVITVPAVCLFNVSAYKPGDFKQFYQDPRTRAQYLKWAPFLIAAEEYHAGNLDLKTGRLVKRKRKGR